MLLFSRSLGLLINISVDHFDPLSLVTQIGHSRSNFYIRLDMSWRLLFGDFLELIYGNLNFLENKKIYFQPKHGGSDGRALDSRPRGPGFESCWILWDLLLSVTRTINNHGSQEVRVCSLIKWLPPVRNNESNNDLLMTQELLDYMLTLQL